MCMRAVRELGAVDQLHMLAEECSELAVAAHHVVRGREYARAALIEELADVCIMSTQAELILNITDAEVYEAIERKLTRLEEQLDRSLR